jgi:1,4-dihydroxy-6-naphthoate synthase
MPNEQVIRLGISTCPNDTFAFHAILTGKINIPGVRLDVQLMDVQELNERLHRDEFDVAKASFYAALSLTPRYAVLRSGSALGFGVGPLLLADREGIRPDTLPAESFTTLCPGRHTTASLLYRLFYPNCGSVGHVVFSEIMPALQRHDVHFGVCIHEGRFTYQQQGLHLVEDLGSRWERETGLPLPLGGILCRHDLGPQRTGSVQHAIAASLRYALEHRQEALVSMRKYAQEFSDEVLFSHVDLYVNRWTLDLGDEGGRALGHLHDRAVSSGAIAADLPPLKIVPAD